MKIQGVTIEPPKEEVIVIPRGSQQFVFKAKAVLDFSEFEQLCPPPVPRTRTKPGGEKETLINEPKHLEAVNKWSLQKTAWTILQSLSATEGLEWDKVKMSDPETWELYHDELKENFSELEAGLIVQKVLQACSLSPSHIEEATNRFLAGQEAEQK